MHALYQRLRELDWDTFQRFCAQLLAEKHPTMEIRHVEGVAGDKGLDIFVGKLTGRPIVWQCKNFSNGLRSGQYCQVIESLRTATRHFHPAKWILIVPVDLDVKAEAWLQGIREKYASKTSVGWMVATDIVRELTYRRSLRETFFPGAVMDSIMFKRVIRNTQGLKDADLEVLASDNVAELISRFEEHDARFTYRIAYGPNAGADAMERPTLEPSLITSVWDGDKRIDVFARDIQSVTLDPPTVNVELHGSGPEKLREFLRTGRPQKLEPADIVSVRSTFDFLLPTKQLHGQEIVLSTSPVVTSRRLKLRATFSKEGEQSVRYEYVEFAIVRGGSEEVEIQSTADDLPFVITFCFPLTEARTGVATYKDRFVDFDVRKVAKALRIFKLVREGGSIELHDLEKDTTMCRLTSESLRLRWDERFDEAIFDAAKIAERFNVNIPVPQRITSDDRDRMRYICAAIDGSPIITTGFSMTLVKSKEREATILAALRERSQIRLTSPHSEPQMVFGVPINAGPMTLEFEDALLIDPDKVRQQYQELADGETIPLKFTTTTAKVRFGYFNGTTFQTSA